MQKIERGKCEGRVMKTRKGRRKRKRKRGRGRGTQSNHGV
jgi:hypothetical protein